MHGTEEGLEDGCPKSMHASGYCSGGDAGCKSVLDGRWTGHSGLGNLWNGSYDMTILKCLNVDKLMR